MNDRIIVTVDHLPTNAGLFASVVRLYGSDDAEVITCVGREALWHMREVWHAGLQLRCGFVPFLWGRGR